jgi:hypothetical protein
MQREQVLLCESDRWKLEKMGNEPDNTTYLTYNKRYTIKTMSLLPIPTKLYYYTQASEEHASLSLSLSLSLCVCEWCWVLQHELFCLSRVSRGSKLRSTFPQRTKNTGYQAHVGQNFTFFCKELLFCSLPTTKHAMDARVSTHTGQHDTCGQTHQPINQPSLN